MFSLSHGSARPIQRLTLILRQRLTVQIKAPPSLDCVFLRVLHRWKQRESTNTHLHRTKQGTKKKKQKKSLTGRKGSERKSGGKASELGIGDGVGSKGDEEDRRGRAPGRRRAEEEVRLPLRQGRPAVPRRPHRALPQAGTLRQAHRQRRPRLPRRRPRVPRGRGPRAGGERGQGQQEEPDHPAARAARGPQRPGAREAARRRHHRARRGAAQHQPCAAPQKDRRGGCQGSQAGQGDDQVAQEGPRQEGGRLLGPALHNDGAPSLSSPLPCLSV